MKSMRSRVLAIALGAVTLTMLFACEVTGVGVDGSVGVGYGGGYYEPYGYDYGGWGGGYLVGPGRCCGRDHHDDDRRGGREPGGHEPGGRAPGAHAPAYRPAPAGRSAPSIPGRSRGH
jgi:hypothetical protein